MTTPLRLRMFAGPNGSGKTTLVRKLAKDFSLTGFFQLNHYINADDFLRDLKSDRGVQLRSFGLAPSTAILREAMINGGRIGSDHPFVDAFRIEDGVLVAPATTCDSYVTASLADYLRDELLAKRESLSFETVMSHRSKVDFFARARSVGYRTYLYFIATDDVDLNVRRVEARADLGGHDVPEQKILERFLRTLNLLGDAIPHAYRAFFFDNSGTEPTLLAETGPDGKLQLQVAERELPTWFLSHVGPPFGF